MSRQFSRRGAVTVLSAAGWALTLSAAEMVPPSPIGSEAERRTAQPSQLRSLAQLADGTLPLERVAEVAAVLKVAVLHPTLDVAEWMRRAGQDPVPYLRWLNASIDAEEIGAPT
jgi:hypothetical protein